MGTPFFSVLMPVYNTENFLRRAIDSVLMQSFRDFELILVDDCSPKKIFRIIDRH